MVKWVQAHLNNGQHEGQQLVSAGNLTQMHQSQFVIQDALFKTLGQTDLMTYGMGWFVQPYRGHTLIHHGGNIDGFSAFVSFIPDADIGTICLTNLNSNSLGTAVSYTLYDRLLELEPIDWNERYLTIYGELMQAAELNKSQSDEERKPDTTPSHPLKDYAGEYQHPGYHDFTVAEQESALVATFNSIKGPLNHYHYDVFEWHPEEGVGQNFKIAFGADLKGNVATLSIPLEPMVKAIQFTRKPGHLDADTLSEFVGVYAMPVADLKVTVSLKDDGTLIAQTTGQPEVALVPYMGTEFTLKGVPNVSMEFKRDETGAVSEVLVKQGGAVFKSPRAR
jgi:hypothetical protein